MFTVTAHLKVNPDPGSVAKFEDTLLSAQIWPGPVVFNPNAEGLVVMEFECGNDTGYGLDEIAAKVAGAIALKLDCSCSYLNVEDLR